MSRGASAEKRSLWSERLQRFAQAELSVVEFCRREQVSVPSFYQWRRKLTDSSKGAIPCRPTRASFLPVRVSAATDLQVKFPNGARLTLPASDHELVRLSIEAIAQTRTMPGEA